jgi:hypothetical protein
LCGDLRSDGRGSDVFLRGGWIRRDYCSIKVCGSGCVRDRGVGKVLSNDGVIERGDERAGISFALHLTKGVLPNGQVRLVRWIIRIQFLARLEAGLGPEARVRLLENGVLVAVGRHVIS